MTSSASVSRVELAQRREQLRQRRRWRLLRMSWQVGMVGSFAGGLIWLLSLPIWSIQRPQQVIIKGNRHLTTETIQALLPLRYPRSLFAIHPHQIVETLEVSAPIAKATVTRHLWPLGLTIEIQERPLVAITLPGPILNSTGANRSLSSPKGSATSAGKPMLGRSHPVASQTSARGFLDEAGVWMPQEAYRLSHLPAVMPQLQVIGMQDQYRTNWPQLYQAIRRTPVKISSIDWRDPSNLILGTELGPVHVGAYSSRFSLQLQTLDRMRQLPAQVDKKNIAYIDLRNLAAPALRMLNPKQPMNEQSISP